MTSYVIIRSNSINNTTPSNITSGRDIGAGDNLYVADDGYVISTAAVGVYVNGYATNSNIIIDGLVMGVSAGIYSLGTNASFTISGRVVGVSTGMVVSSGGQVHITSTGVVSGSSGMSLSSGGMLVNDGNITGKSGEAIQLSGGNIINNGTITGTTESIFFDPSSNGQITNNGTIQGSLMTWYGATDPAINLTIVNNGYWYGSLGLTPGDDSVQNTGKIVGDVTLGGGNDTFDSRYGTMIGSIYGGDGNDTILAGQQDDTIDGGAGADIINGGGGNNTVSYQSSTGRVRIDLSTGVAQYGDAAGDRLKHIQNVNGTLKNDILIGDNQDNTLVGVLGKDRLSGNGGDDTFLEYGGGNAIISGGSGNDLVQLVTVDSATYGFAFSAANKIDGGAGYDTLDLTNSGSVVFRSSTLVNVERILVQDGYDYDLTTADATVARGKLLSVDAGALTGAHSLSFDGGAEKNGRFFLEGGEGADVLKGGAGADKIAGGGGADVLTGRGGADIFIFNDVSDSLFSSRDRITDFNAGIDAFQFDVDVTGLDGARNGSVTNAADLTALLSGHLHAGHAVLVNVTAGALNGHTLLVVDADGVAGYFAGGDYVVDVNITGTLTINDFLA